MEKVLNTRRKMSSSHVGLPIRWTKSNV